MHPRRRKRRADDLDSDSEREEFILASETLMGRCDSIWDVIEFGFYRGSAGWVDLLVLIVRMLGNDFEDANKGIASLTFLRREAS
jgi:hypothetical protein